VDGAGTSKFIFAQYRWWFDFALFKKSDGTNSLFVLFHFIGFWIELGFRVDIQGLYLMQGQCILITSDFNYTQRLCLIHGLYNMRLSKTHVSHFFLKWFIGTLFGAASGNAWFSTPHSRIPCHGAVYINVYVNRYIYLYVCMYILMYIYVYV